MRRLTSCLCGTPPKRRQTRSLSLQPPELKPAHEAVAAAENGQLAISFSGGGFFMSYFVGVVHQLMHMDLLKPGTTHLCGSSAGSIIAACVTSGVSLPQVLSSFLSAAADCREQGVPGRLSAVLSAQLHEHLPPDAHERCSGRAHIGITRVWPVPVSQVVSQFKTRDELVEAVLASCHLPLLSNGKMTTTYNGNSVMDGGLTALIPMPADSSLYSQVIKVACLPKQHIPHIPMLNKKAALKGIAVAPDLFEDWPHTLQQTLEWALKPGPHTFLTSLMERGARDTVAWATTTGLLQHLGPHRAKPAPPLFPAVPEWDPAKAQAAAEHLPIDKQLLPSPSGREHLQQVISSVAAVAAAGHEAEGAPGNVPGVAPGEVIGGAVGVAQVAVRSLPDDDVVEEQQVEAALEACRDGKEQALAETLGHIAAKKAHQN